MATNIPPHNMVETINALVALIDHPEITVEELMAHLPGPDFPTGGFIFGKEGIRAPMKGQGCHSNSGQSCCRTRSERRAGKYCHHRASLSDQQGETDRAHRGAGSREGH